MLSTIPDNREHAVGPIEIVTQTSVRPYLLSLSQTTASPARNNVASRSKWKWMWALYAVDGEWRGSHYHKVAVEWGKTSLSSAETPYVVLSLGLSMREEKTLSGVRLQATISLSLELVGLGIWSLELEPWREGLHFVRGGRWLPCARESSSIALSWPSTANVLLWIMLSLLCCAANAAPSSPHPFPK